jgi:hypothetical protein
MIPTSQLRNFDLGRLRGCAQAGRDWQFRLEKVTPRGHYLSPKDLGFDLDLEPGANRVGLHLVPVLVNYWQEIASWGANVLSDPRVRKAPIESCLSGRLVPSRPGPQCSWFANSRFSGESPGTAMRLCL